MLINLDYDFNDILAFFSARYRVDKEKDLLEMGYEEFSAKLSSIPSSEPLYDIIKSRAINLAEIKNKQEKSYWRKLKESNRIPDIYKSNQEIIDSLAKRVGQNKEGLYETRKFS